MNGRLWAKAPQNLADQPGAEAPGNEGEQECVSPTVNKLRGEDREAEIGMVMSPIDIINRMRHGAYDLGFYPTFE